MAGGREKGCEGEREKVCVCVCERESERQEAMARKAHPATERQQVTSPLTSTPSPPSPPPPQVTTGVPRP